MANNNFGGCMELMSVSWYFTFQVLNVPTVPKLDQHSLSLSLSAGITESGREVG